MTIHTEMLAPVDLPESILTEMFDSSERAATIVAAAYIDDDLKRKIQTKLGPCEDPEKDPLFDIGDRPLNSFSAKIILAERMGIILPDVAAVIHRLRKIRIKYAHKPEITDTSIIDMRNDLVSRFFYGRARKHIGDFANTPAIHCSGSYSTETPVSRMLKSGASQEEVAFRIMLLVLIGYLGASDFTTGSFVSISYTYTVDPAALSSVSLFYH